MSPSDPYSTTAVDGSMDGPTALPDLTSISPTLFLYLCSLLLPSYASSPLPRPDLLVHVTTPALQPITFASKAQSNTPLISSPTQSFTAPTSSTSTDPSTQRTANATLTTERITTFLADTSLTPPIVSPYPGYLDRKNTIASRCRAATDAIASFDEVFNCAHRIENKDEEGNNEKESQQQKQTKSNNGRDEK
ncbi:hypothetical protein BKA64DRAFT_708833 [Cadophora sp. MPI-SDFR-AT-0126]|nr:hypothetical protein BKA64DRAFT_708833 [Leotiomycetes sp. MPI-SDFR-AT-0126]